MRALTPQEAAYIAGFIDGEGTFNVLRTTQRFFVEMSAGQVDRRPLNFLHEKMGGTICMRAAQPKKNQRPLWIYHLSSGSPFDFYVPQLIPYLILKKRKAEIALEMRERLRIPKHTARRVKYRIEMVDGEEVIAEDRIIKSALPSNEFEIRMAIVRRAQEEQARWGKA